MVRTRKSTGWRSVRVQANDDAEPGRRSSWSNLKNVFRSERRRSITTEYLSPWSDTYHSIDPRKVSIYSPINRAKIPRSENGSDFAKSYVSQNAFMTPMRLMIILIMLANILLLVSILAAALRH